MKQLDRSALEMALVGYEAEREKIDATMAAIRKQVDGHSAAPSIDSAGIFADGTTWPAPL